MNALWTCRNAINQSKKWHLLVRIGNWRKIVPPDTPTRRLGFGSREMLMSCDARAAARPFRAQIYWTFLTGILGCMFLRAFALRWLFDFCWTLPGFVSWLCVRSIDGSRNLSEEDLNAICDRSRFCLRGFEWGNSNKVCWTKERSLGLFYTFCFSLSRWW